MLNLTNLIGLGVGGDPAQLPHRYWRIRQTQAGVGSFANNDWWVEFSEIEMRATIGGADQCNGGTPSASSVLNNAPAYDASKPFDNITTTYWDPDPADAQAVTSWIKYDFGSAKIVQEVGLKAFYTAAGMYGFDVEYSDDDVTYHKSKGFTNQTGYNNTTFLSFALF